MRVAIVWVVAVMLLGCRAPTLDKATTCSRADMTAFMPADHARAMDKLGAEWFKDAVVCKVGEVLFVSPADPARTDYIVIRNAAPEVVRLNDGTFGVLDGKHLQVNLLDSDRDGHFDGLVYDTWKWNGDRYLSATDWNADGQIDVRTTELPDRTLKNEGWASGAWHQFRFEGGMRLVSDPSRRLGRNEAGELEVVDWKP